MLYRKALPQWLILGLPVLLGVLYWATQPFAEPVASRTLSVQALSRVQKNNLQIAARALDGVVLRPGETFSFNRLVGPRTVERGYQPAPSYLGVDNPNTLGGGICLLSSALYELALDGGLGIQERVPHLRTVHSVPPGLDASVWYGQADLRVVNPWKTPLLLKTHFDPEALTVSLEGHEAHKNISLRRIVVRPSRDQLQVAVFRTMAGKETLISRDLYSVAR